VLTSSLWKNLSNKSYVKIICKLYSPERFYLWGMVTCPYSWGDSIKKDIVRNKISIIFSLVQSPAVVQVTSTNKRAPQMHQSNELKLRNTACPGRKECGNILIRIPYHTIPFSYHSHPIPFPATQVPYKRLAPAVVIYEINLIKQWNIASEWNAIRDSQEAISGR